jgi:hypothetical protein
MSLLRAMQIFLVLFLIITGISASIMAYRMRQRMRKALGGKKASEANLTSINTWMDVDEAEEKSRVNKPPNLK